MHYLPDTSEADAASETFWPENYKKVIREYFRRAIGVRLSGEDLRHVYEKLYSSELPDLSQFTERLADMVTIGAENGTDDVFDDIYSSFLTEAPLPYLRKDAHPVLPDAFPADVEERIRRAVIADYEPEKVFRHAYKVGYQRTYTTYDDFINRVADLIVAGAKLGADDMVRRLYRSFLNRLPLPPARRHPKRLKSW
jgi:hypothetical protein